MMRLVSHSSHKHTKEKEVRHMKSHAGSLNGIDIRRIFLNIMVFNVPTFLLIFLTAYSQGLDVKSSLITAAISFLTAIVDIGKKIAAGQDPYPTTGDAPPPVSDVSNQADIIILKVRTTQYESGTSGIANRSTGNRIPRKKEQFTTGRQNSERRG